MSITKLQDVVTDLESIAKQNINLLKDRQSNLEELSKAADNLNDTSKIFHRVSEENKWRLWRKNNSRSIKMAFVLFGVIIILFLLLAGFIKIIF
jgi:hypothetical protein